MGLTRRILEGARTGLHSLTSLVIVDDEELSVVDPAALEAELKARRAARDGKLRRPEDNPVAKMAGSSQAARAARADAAQKRGAKVKQERSAKEARDRQAADDAFRRMKQNAGKPGAGASSSSSSPPPRTPRPGSNEAQL